MTNSALIVSWCSAPTSPGFKTLQSRNSDVKASTSTKSTIIAQSRVCVVDLVCNRITRPGVFNDGNSPSCAVLWPSRIPVRLSFKALIYHASWCPPLGSISGSHKGILRSSSGSWHILATGGAENAVGMSSGGNGDVLLGNMSITGSPIPFPICPSKIADENPLSQSGFPSAMVFKIFGQSVRTPFEPSSTPASINPPSQMPPLSSFKSFPSSLSSPTCLPIRTPPSPDPPRKAPRPKKYNPPRVCRRQGNHAPPITTAPLLPISSRLLEHFEVQFAASGGPKYVVLPPHLSWLMLNSIRIPRNFNHLTILSSDHAPSLSKDIGR